MCIAVYAITQVTTNTPKMSDLSIYAWIVFGILVSFIMPVLKKWAGIDRIETFGKYIANVWTNAVRPYLYLAGFSFLAALVILAGIHVKKIQIDSSWGAFLLGYFADATIQKLKP